MGSTEKGASHKHQHTSGRIVTRKRPKKTEEKPPLDATDPTAITSTASVVTDALRTVSAKIPIAQQQQVGFTPAVVYDRPLKNEPVNDNKIVRTIYVRVYVDYICRYIYRI